MTDTQLPKSTVPDDGGPAFPGPGEVFQYSDGSYGESPREGMTLRDHFAGLALTALVGNVNQVHFGLSNVGTNRTYATVAYSLADALIWARQQPVEPAI